MFWPDNWTKRIARLRTFASTKHRLIPVSLLRICLGCTLLVYYAQHVAQREFLWGNSGVVPFRLFRALMLLEHNFSLYMLSSSPAFHWLIFYLGFSVTIAFTLGYKSRVSSVLFYIFTWSLFQRNPFILDGGDNLLYLVSFLLMFTDCGAYLSLDIAFAKKRKETHPLVAVLHNYAVLAIIVQVSLLYFTSAFFKTQGHMWQNGTAIYYVLRSSEFNLSPYAHYFYDSDAVVTLLTWSTVIFQFAWPFLIWNRRLKPFVALGALALHSMIGYFMGLVWFSFVMLSSELIIFEDSELLRLVEFIRATANRVRQRAISAKRVLTEAAFLPGRTART